MLTACRPNFANVVCTTYKVEILRHRVCVRYQFTELKFVTFWRITTVWNEANRRFWFIYTTHILATRGENW